MHDQITLLAELGDAAASSSGHLGEWVEDLAFVVVCRQLVPNARVKCGHNLFLSNSQFFGLKTLWI